MCLAHHAVVVIFCALGDECRGLTGEAYRAHVSNFILGEASVLTHEFAAVCAPQSLAAGQRVQA